MSRYFNTDAFLKSVKQKAYPQSGSANESERKISLFGIMEILTAMPTPDVVEVVRCGYCKYYKNTICQNPNGLPRYLDENEFCSNGKRREDGKNIDADAVKAQPTADMVKVVRCEKCTYGYIDPNNFHGYCRKRRDMIYANDFCSKGERIDE